ncbi:hypothetical protein, partial [Alistipes finegoldii]|uniref:hypothetical protein n=1 Tax=Alistipes finegoldii TaxID=214856 RepID=UPI00242BC308
MLRTVTRPTYRPEAGLSGKRSGGESPKGDKIQRWLLIFNRNTYLCKQQIQTPDYTMAKAVNIARSHRLDGIGEYYFSRRLREIA